MNMSIIYQVVKFYNGYWYKQMIQKVKKGELLWKWNHHSQVDAKTQQQSMDKIWLCFQQCLNLHSIYIKNKM